MNERVSGGDRSIDGKVLVTGAGGYIASMLLPHLAERYELRLVDVGDLDERHGATDVHVADLASEDRSAVAPLFDGVDTVIHLGYIRSAPEGVYDRDVPHLERFDAEFANVRMAFNVYRCALEAGVRRVVMASSNHAADWYEHALIHENRAELVTPETPPLSDNFYGWSKAAYELLGFPFACGTFGRALEVVQIRIGAPRELDVELHSSGPEIPGPGPHLPAGIAGLKRHLATYLSEADCRQIFTRAVEVADVRNEHGIPWLVVYGISGNTRAFWSLESARRVLGFDPIDDSEARFADEVHRSITGPDLPEGRGRVGS